MTWQGMDTAPRDGTTVKLRPVRDESRTVKAAWVDEQWKYERRDGVVIFTTDRHYNAWSPA